MVVFLICIAIVISFPLVWYIVAKFKQRGNLETTELNKEQIRLEKEIKSHISDVDLGCFGKFSKEKIDISWLLCVEDNKDKVVEKFTNWKNIIENNSQYIINYFMTRPLMYFDFDETWDDWWLTDDQKMMEEEDLILLRENKQKKIQKELDKYLQKETILDIKEIYKKYLPKFDYNTFINSIKLEYLTIGEDDISLQLSDKEWIFFCAAYINFDKDLKDFDWHNF